MPNITVVCCTCGNKKQFDSVFEAEDFVDRCNSCTNDVCPRCLPTRHADCDESE